MFFDKFTVSLSPLNLLKEKEQGVITRLNCSDKRILDKLNSLGIMPGLSVRLERKFPDFVISAEDTLLRIDKSLAQLICVKVVI